MVQSNERLVDRGWSRDVDVDWLVGGRVLDLLWNGEHEAVARAREAVARAREAAAHRSMCACTVIFGRDPHQRGLHAHSLHPQWTPAGDWWQAGLA